MRAFTGLLQVVTSLAPWTLQSLLATVSEEEGAPMWGIGCGDSPARYLHPS